MKVIVYSASRAKPKTDIELRPCQGGWIIEVDSLDHLFELNDEFGPFILDGLRDNVDGGDIQQITIYDDYIE